MGIFAKQNKTGGFADVIRCDQPNYLIWKWHPSGAAQGELKRETAIRTNSVLRVKEGEVAVFVYKQKDGTNQDFIVGPYLMMKRLKQKTFQYYLQSLDFGMKAILLFKLKYSSLILEELFK